MAAKLGFTKIYVPKILWQGSTPSGIQVVGVSTLQSLEESILIEEKRLGRKS